MQMQKLPGLLRSPFAAQVRPRGRVSRNIYLFVTFPRLTWSMDDKHYHSPENDQVSP